MTVGEKIAYYRCKKGYSQEKLADLLNVSRQTIYKWESNKAYPKIEKLKALTEVLSIDYNKLLDFEEE